MEKLPEVHGQKLFPRVAGHNLSPMIYVVQTVSLTHEDRPRNGLSERAEVGCAAEEPRAFRRGLGFFPRSSKHWHSRVLLRFPSALQPRGGVHPPLRDSGAVSDRYGSRDLVERRVGHIKGFHLR